jgi:hypothetical protein
MAIPIKGNFSQRYTVPYQGAGVWGTGINPVHSFYGSPNDRLGGLRPREGDVTPPFGAVPQELIPEPMYGYQMEDRPNQYYVSDGRPGWNVEPPENPSRYSTGDMPSWNATGAARTRFRSLMQGAYSTWRGKLPAANYMEPSETVSEGWVNKPTGRPANSKPSDPSQYEIQTSMQQRYRARNNDNAVLRGTDYPRSHINSRVTGMIVKEYSMGDRIYDMQPKEQSPDNPRMSRDFYYRTAGTGLQDQMAPNAMYDITTIERTPPSDPYMGQTDVTIPSQSTDQYGYTQEDAFYA